jgi:peptide-methionine (R)-S-oxide reductase
MKKIISTILSVLTVSMVSCQTPEKNKENAEKHNDEKTKQPMETSYNKTDAEWKKILTPEQYRVLREKGTEAPGTGEYNKHFEKGWYVCAGCGTELFSNEQKFDSHCGWPSFDGELGGGDRIKKVKDFSYGMIRTEIVCAKCGGHLGHIFDDGPTATGQRYCVNSLSLGFKPAKDSTEKK